jgi:hypothetical protein
MPCDRNDAIFRLISLWCDRVADDEDLPLWVGLADVITEETIQIVMANDLCPEHSEAARLRRIEQLNAAADAARRRDRAILVAWMAPRPRLVVVQ